jgi:mannose-6-phosphate isomerase-like protein (cupin superfamily)
MSPTPATRQLRPHDLELLDIKVTRDGGTVRYLEGGGYGLRTSVFQSEVVPGSGPEPHAHPYAEFFVIHAGHGRFFVGDVTIDADAGDIVIVPPNVVHHFVNTGSGRLHQTAIHEAPVAVVRRP